MEPTGDVLNSINQNDPFWFLKYRMPQKIRSGAQQVIIFYLNSPD